MLWRYVGVTLVALGGAMLVAPQTEDERSSAPQTTRPSAPDPDPGAVAVAPPAAAAPDAAAGMSAADRERETLVPAALSLDVDADVTEDAGDGGAPRLAGLDPTRVDAPAPSGEAPGPASRSDGGTAAAAAPAELPSLERPETVRPAEITAETLALIERAGETPTPDAETAAAAEPDRLFVSGSRVNVRSGPGTSYAVIGSTVYGEAVELLGFENGAWAWVRFGDDRMGYMARSFLEQDPGDG